MLRHGLHPKMKSMICLNFSIYSFIVVFRNRVCKRSPAMSDTETPSVLFTFMHCFTFFLPVSCLRRKSFRLPCKKAAMLWTAIDQMLFPVPFRYRLNTPRAEAPIPVTIYKNFSKYSGTELFPLQQIRNQGENPSEQCRQRNTNHKEHAFSDYFLFLKVRAMPQIPQIFRSRNIPPFRTGNPI